MACIYWTLADLARNSKVLHCNKRCMHTCVLPVKPFATVLYKSFSDSLALHCTDWSKEDWAKVKVLLKCGTGKDASTKQELQVGVL